MVMSIIESLKLMTLCSFRSGASPFPRFKKTILALAALIIGLVSAEAFLRTVSLVFPQIDELVTPPEVIRDATLEYRFSCSPWERSVGSIYKGTATGPVRLVALGDSITYGSGVTPEEAWPQTLQALREEQSFPRLGQQDPQFPTETMMRQYVAQKVSYWFGGPASQDSSAALNMSCPGYGPVQYVWMLEEALKLKPDTIVVTFYLGNDLFDAFHLVDLYHFTGQLKVPPYDWPLERVLEELRRTSPDVRQGTADLSHAVVPDNRDALRLMGLLRSVYTMSEYKFGSTRESGFGGKLFKSITRAAATLSPDAWFFDDGAVCTTFSFKRVLRAVNLRDDIVKTGLRYSMEAYKLMKQRADEAGVRFYVLVVPTKHTVFKGAVLKHCAAQGIPVPARFRAVIENEHRIREATLAFFGDNGIAHVDTLPALEAALVRGSQSYKISVDNHPNAYGQRVIARSILKAVEGPQFAAH
jgi:hypothetical protein